ncbi:dermonecrotic toxin domain-containing protein [Pseudomonas petrae]|uniref:Uncharacterized protein n=1 Tax=Pseudomonas petrae TaxID=2912190 RepID=A0ABS9I0Q4_9PSED|nr:DUF6543 domain-containing protein [Pseudomonas petrae]MCF7534413.1 hypothetical protein [Pseudomonas petrae]MCF7538710.1 hypothetical protein [Pseudomonas petrae]MCF7541120.1 hypothetical protein [Pseudomonas petrae]MCF7555937.1 hypothetical protein [Pseudomonas petrae]
MNDSSSSHPASSLDLSSNDSLPHGSAFSVSPFAERVRPAQSLEPSAVAPAQPHTLNHKRLMRQAVSPVAELFYGSVWVLKAWHLDLEFPPSVVRHLDQRLKETLQARFGAPIDLDELEVSFSTALEPAVEADGRERFELRLTLRELGREVLNPPGLLALRRCAEPDRPLSASTPSLTVSVFFELLLKARWTLEHAQMQRRFWERHGTAWEMLAKLAFLDGLTRLHSRKRIDNEGHLLALDALGLTRFPQHIRELQPIRPPARSVVRGLALNGEIIPGIFHVRSNTTGHCYVHVLGSAPHCHEYISDDAPWKADEVLQAINASAWHRLNLSLESAQTLLTLTAPSDDAFTQLRVAQQRFWAARLTGSDAVESPDALIDDDHAALMPIEPALAVVSALDYWQHHEPLLARIPTPLGVANRLMGQWLRQMSPRPNRVPLRKTHTLITDPQRVFIRYLPGTSRTPWGHPRIAAANVIVTPDETPVTLGQALISRFRARQPQGYDDEGGRWVVYADTSGQGTWSTEAELNISAASVEAYIQGIDFLGLMRRRLDQFWQQQHADVERSLWSTFVGQALVALKSGDLSMDSFQMVIDAVEQAQQVHVPQAPLSVTARIRWSAVGFYVSNGLPLSSDCPPCVGLLVMSATHREGGVLYQAGQSTPFVPFSDRQQLVDHLTAAAANPAWRETVLNYMPRRFHARLSYILELWGGVRAPAEPVSTLRPWTEPLYNPDSHAARQRQLCEQEVSGSPMGFICESLRLNSQYDAEDSIVTDREQALGAWIQHLNRLQLLLAPMALLLPATSIAALTASAASVALNIQAANLPGDRQEERRQVMFAILSLGLLHMAPATPRLFQAFSKLAAPTAALSRGLGRGLRQGLTRGQSALPARRFGDWLRRSTQPRKTLLKAFFNGAGLMKTWRVAGNAEFGTSAVQVWKLGRKFLLWTSDRTQARTLVVSSHGYYLPWTRTTAIPNGTELRTFAPHGHELVDPMLHRIASQSVRPYAMLNSAQTLPGPDVGPFPGFLVRDTLMAGTTLPGRIKNYTLAKFQSEHYESYRDISQIVRNSHQPPLPSPLPATPMDVLTVRNRFGMTNPTLQDLFGELHRQGIHYDNILLVHCRCPAVGSMLGRSPSFVAPQGQSPITP